jgi:hypothetical protein
MGKTFVRAIAGVLAASVSLLALPAPANAVHDPPPTEDINQFISDVEFAYPGNRITGTRTTVFAGSDSRYDYTLYLDNLWNLFPSGSGAGGLDMWDFDYVWYLNGQKLEVEALDSIARDCNDCDWNTLSTNGELDLSSVLIYNGFDADRGGRYELRVDPTTRQQDPVENCNWPPAEDVAGAEEEVRKKILAAQENCRNAVPYTYLAFTLEGGTPKLKPARCKLVNVKVKQISKYEALVKLKKNKKNSKCLKPTPGHSPGKVTFNNLEDSYKWDGRKVYRIGKRTWKLYNSAAVHYNNPDREKPIKGTKWKMTHRDSDPRYKDSTYTFVVK